MTKKYKAAFLKHSQYDDWNRFVDKSPQGCIFCKTWWLDIVAEGRYTILAVFNKDTLVGGIPLVNAEGKKNSYFTMPPLTQTLGILLLNMAGSYVKIISKEKKIIDVIVESIGNPNYFVQNFHYNFLNWLPFMWEGYVESTRYSYVIRDLSDTSAIWSNFAKNIKSDINKAKRLKLRVVEDNLGRDKFWQIHKMTFDRQNMTPPVTFEFFKKLDSRLEYLEKRKMLFVIDEDDKVHAVVYLVWDKKTAYYLMGGADPNLRNSGATSFGLWEAIKLSSSIVNQFDFEGSVVKNIERHFRAFGGSQMQYFQIRKIKSKFQIMKQLIKSKSIFNP